MRSRIRESASAARAAGRTAGFEEGKAQCARRIRATGRQACARKSPRRSRDFAAERDSYFHRVEEQVVRLTLAIARKILHREAQVDPLLLTGVLRVALEKIGSNSSNTRLRANPADIKSGANISRRPARIFPRPN